MEQDLVALEESIRRANLPLDDATLVFGRGCSDADVFIVGEAPGEEEDEEGEPFVGRSGSVLDDALAEAGLDGQCDVYIGNVLKYRPPGNRDPRVDEIREHGPFLLEQISVVDPCVVVPLGNTAAEFFFGEEAVFSGISQERGQRFTTVIGGVEYDVFPTYHPAATLYDRSLRSVFVDDFVGVVDMVSED